MLDMERLRSLSSDLSTEDRRVLDGYIGEAQFFRELLDERLRSLDQGSRVLEVGSGIGLLSLLVAEAGFFVDAYEPLSSGFDRMELFQDLIRSSWIGPSHGVSWHGSKLLELKDDSPCDLVVAIHVFEHVPDWSDLLLTAMSHVSEEGVLKVISPNYAFPYEPHLEMPTLWNKRLTSNLFRKKVAQSDIPNVYDFWSDLSWITTRQLKSEALAHGFTIEVSRRATHLYVERAGSDESFKNRKSKMLLNFARATSSVWSVLPINFLPIIDAEVRNK